VLALSAFLYFAQQVFPCWLAWWQVEDLIVMLVPISWEYTPPYLSTRISNLLQPAQAEVVLGQRSMYLASWGLATNQGRRQPPQNKLFPYLMI
jgi:hypothetical protein